MNNPEDIDVANFRMLQSVLISLIQTLHENNVLSQDKVFSVISARAKKTREEGRQIEAALLEKFMNRTLIPDDQP